MIRPIFIPARQALRRTSPLANRHHSGLCSRLKPGRYQSQNLLEERLSISLNNGVGVTNPTEKINILANIRTITQPSRQGVNKNLAEKRFKSYRQKSRTNASKARRQICICLLSHVFLIKNTVITEPLLPPDSHIYGTGQGGEIKDIHSKQLVR